MELDSNLPKKQSLSSKRQSSIISEVEGFIVNPNSNVKLSPHDIRPDSLMSNSVSLEASANPNSLIKLNIDKLTVGKRNVILKMQPKEFDSYDPRLSLRQQQIHLLNLPAIFNYNETVNILSKAFGPIGNQNIFIIDPQEGFGATYYMMVGKIYHAPAYGFWPQLFRMTEPQLYYLQHKGLPAYVSRGGDLPTPHCLQELGKAFINHYQTNKGNINYNSSFQGKRAIAIHSAGNQVMVFHADKKLGWSFTEVSKSQKAVYLQDGGVHNTTQTPLGTQPPSLN